MALLCLRNLLFLLKNYSRPNDDELEEELEGASHLFVTGPFGIFCLIAPFYWQYLAWRALKFRMHKSYGFYFVTELLLVDVLFRKSRAPLALPLSPGRATSEVAMTRNAGLSPCSRSPCTIAWDIRRPQPRPPCKAGDNLRVHGPRFGEALCEVRGGCTVPLAVVFLIYAVFQQEVLSVVSEDQDFARERRSANKPNVLLSAARCSVLAPCIRVPVVLFSVSTGDWTCARSLLGHGGPLMLLLGANFHRF